MGERIDIIIEVDDSELKESEKKIETHKEKSDRILSDVARKTQESYHRVLSAARGAYLLGLGLVKAGGESVSYFFRAMMSAAFSTVQVLYPQLQAALHKGAATYDPHAIAEAVMGIASLATSISAMAAAEAGNTDIARSLRGADMALLGIQQLIGELYFV